MGNPDEHGENMLLQCQDQTLSEPMRNVTGTLSGPVWDKALAASE